MLGKEWDFFYSLDLDIMKEICCFVLVSVVLILVLVGKCYIFCNKLKDEYGWLGLFFFVMDLGVWIEGRFCL